MSTIDASRDHRGSEPPIRGARFSHVPNVRRTLSYALIGPSGSTTRRAAITLGLVVGSALLASSGVIHLQLWATGYRTIPTIGPLFLLQGIAGVLLAVVLLLWRRLLVVVAAAGFMVATIGGLLVSVEFRPIRLHGYLCGTICWPLGGTRERRGRRPWRCRYGARTWAQSLRPRKSADRAGEVRSVGEPMRGPGGLGNTNRSGPVG